MRSFTKSQWICWATLSLSIVCVLVVNQAGRRWETCTDPELVANALGIPGTATLERMAVAGSDLSFAWSRGELVLPGSLIFYQIFRSNNPFLLSVNWVRKQKRIGDPATNWVEDREVDGETIRIMWAEEPVEAGLYFSARTSVLGPKPVLNLLWSELLYGPRQLVRGSLPMTTYLVEGASAPGYKDRTRKIASDWLIAAVRQNQKLCAP